MSSISQLNCIRQKERITSMDRDEADVFRFMNAHHLKCYTSEFRTYL